jgi:PEP-CTERM motif
MQRSHFGKFSLAIVAILGAASAVKAQTLIGGFQGASDPTDAGWTDVANSDAITSDPNSTFPAAGVPGYALSLDINSGTGFGNPSLQLGLSPAQITAFNADNYITFTFSVPGGTYTGGYSQVYNLALNAPTYGYNNQSWANASETGNTANDTVGSGPNFYFNDGSNSLQSQVVTLNYSASKAAIIAGGESYLQLRFQGNTGGGAPGDQLFNNVVLSTGPFGTSVVPEPASIGMLGIAGIGLMARRRSKKTA